MPNSRASAAFALPSALAAATRPRVGDSDRFLPVDFPMQEHGTLKDTQGILRHASITKTGDVDVQTIERSVLQAVNSSTAAVPEG
jgi:hypothetical protein